MTSLLKYLDKKPIRNILIIVHIVKANKVFLKKTKNKQKQKQNFYRYGQRVKAYQVILFISKEDIKTLGGRGKH